MLKQANIQSEFSRRNFLQIVAAAGIAGTIWHFGTSPGTTKQHIARRSRSIMATTLNLTVIGPDRDTAETAVDKTIEQMLRLESILTRFHPSSEVSQLNQTGILKNASLPLLELLTLAQNISDKSNGAFDISVLPLLSLHQQNLKTQHALDKNSVAAALKLVNYKNIQINNKDISFTKPGMAVTFDGIGKGYIVDQGVAVLKNFGFDSVFVEAGGDLMAAGSKTGGKPWRIGLKNPRPLSNHEPLLVLETTNRAIASSGDYMQYYTQDMRHHHILNPHTGFSPPELAASTVIAPSVALADGLATASMVLGAKESLTFLKKFPDSEGRFVGKNMKNYTTSDFFA